MIIHIHKEKGMLKNTASFFKPLTILLLFTAAIFLLASCTRSVQTGTRIRGSSGNDGGHIAFTGLDGNMYILNPLEGEAHQLTHDASPGDKSRTEYRHPSWSFDGESLAFVRYRADNSGNVESTLFISDVQGNDKTTLLTSEEIVPFYLYWSPDSRNISFLSSLNSAGELLLQILPSDGGEPAFVDMGQPFYWSWSADSSSILTHTGGSTMEKPEKAAIKLFDLSEDIYSSTTLNYFPAFFQAPQYSPDGSQLLIAAEMLQRHSTLVIARNNGEPEDLLVDWQGPLTFSWSPDGKRIAYVAGRPFPIGGSIGTLNILSMNDGGERSGYQVKSRNILAFFWSPDSTKIALFEPQIVAALLERMREGLLQKQDNLTEWLHATPLGKKKVLLGPSTEQSVHARLDVIDNVISKADSKTLGKCEVCHEDVETELLEVDYTASVCIEHLSKEERRHLESELELAQDVQKMLLPQEVPDIPGLEIAAFSRPAQIVGGDYFDFVDFSNGLHGLAIADVAGHGVSASLHMASIQALLRTLVPVNKSPAEVISQVHKLFIHNIRFETFVTFFIGAFDSSTNKLTYCNAGHLPPMVLRNNESKKESVEMLRPTGAAIGLVEEAEFAEKTIELQKEDLLVLYTDGITEAVNLQNQEFGRERLIKLSQQVNTLPVKEIVQEIRQGLEEFSEGKSLADDTTLVICKIK